MTEQPKGCCPACGGRIAPYRLVFGGELTTFRCEHCGVRLMKNTGLAATGIVTAGLALFFLRRLILDNWIPFLAFIAVLGLVAVAALRNAHIRLATDEDHDVDPEEVIPDVPPPLDPNFRGSSSPPPSASTRDQTR